MGNEIMQKGADAPAPRAAMGLAPKDIGEAYRLAQAFAASGMFAVRSPEAAMVVLLTGMELGLGPAQSMRSIFVVEGKPTLSAQLMVGLCKARRDVCEYFTCTETTAEIATYETKRVGEPTPVRLSFTLADAKLAGVLGKGNWTKFPGAMLRARCSSLLARDVYPDLLANLYDPEEIGARQGEPSPPQYHPSEDSEGEPTAPTVFDALRDDIDSAGRPLPLETAATLWLEHKGALGAEDGAAAWRELLGACAQGTSTAALKRAVAAEQERRATAPCANTNQRQDAPPVSPPVSPPRIVDVPAPATDLLSEINRATSGRALLALADRVDAAPTAERGLLVEALCNGLERLINATTSAKVLAAISDALGALAGKLGQEVRAGTIETLARRTGELRDPEPPKGKRAPPANDAAAEAHGDAYEGDAAADAPSAASQWIAAAQVKGPVRYLAASFAAHEREFGADYERAFAAYLARMGTLGCGPMSSELMLAEARRTRDAGGKRGRRSVAA